MVVRAWLFAFLLAQPPAVSDYQKASELFARRDLHGAEAAVERSLRADPRYVPALTLKARLAIISGRMDEARETLQAAVGADPHLPATRFLLGFCLYLENDFQGALDTLAHADPKDAQVALYQALSEEGLGRTDAAIASYERSLQLDPVNPEARVACSRLLRKEGRLDRAEEMLARAPETRSVLYEKGQCSYERGLYKQAAEFGERALAAAGPAPSEREIRFLLARAYLKAGNRELAAKQRAIFESLPMPLVR